MPKYKKKKNIKKMEYLRFSGSGLELVEIKFSNESNCSFYWLQNGIKPLGASLDNRNGKFILSKRKITIHIQFQTDLN